MCKCAQHTYMDRQQIIGGRNLMCNILHLQQRSSTQMVMLEGQSEHGVPDMYGRSPSMLPLQFNHHASEQLYIAMDSCSVQGTLE